MMNSSKIRQLFLDYFKERQHQVVASSSLIPGNDPTLLFTNAGMVQFKDTFLGQETRGYQRACSAQRCVRAGGKHNDLDNVGYTARHHTFFEMLGNFSFGDYFKREAIQFAWEFLTKVLHLPAEKLWVTVYQDDDEAADIWLNEVGVSPKRFSRCGEADNFWSMGDTGPCGPCTEIFYDHGPDIAGGPPGSPEADGDRYIEIWNLVFMQFNRDKHGQLHPLPKPSVDTGMGLERIAAVVQGVHNNYHIDSFQHIIHAIAAMGKGIDLEHPSLKVIADHIRACSFLIADGVLPSHEGRGYVLRRIIRRAVRHGHRLDLPMPFFNQVVTPLIDVMGEAYPELRTHQALIETTLLREEQQFARTLEQGLSLLQEAMQHSGQEGLSGEIAFKLYDTYGFPLDLTVDMAREHGVTVDIDGFQRCMQQQREQSQSASQFQVDYSISLPVETETAFHGYEHDEWPSSVIALIRDGKSVERLTQGDTGVVILKDTPFYAESGGQVGDRGEIHGQGGIFRVDNTQRQGQIILHHGKLIQGDLIAQQVVQAVIDVPRRETIRLNHTATHLLHAALKQVLGSHVQQKGSLVEAQRARFDFSHPQAVSPETLRHIEMLVNAQIRANHAVETTVTHIEDAKQQGALALFDEKYGDQVRVLAMGDFSKELCGGTHARRTGDIGLFKIVAEYGVASGVRRIEFVTGAEALIWLNEQLNVLQESALKLKTKPANVVEKISQQFQLIKEYEKELTQLRQSMTVQSGNELVKECQQIGDIQLLIKRLDHLDAEGLRHLLDQLKSSLERAVIILYAVKDERISVVAGVSRAILGQVPPAAQFVKQVCGKGGGRDDMAQGGGPVPADLESRVANVASLIAN